MRSRWNLVGSLLRGVALALVLAGCAPQGDRAATPPDRGTTGTVEDRADARVPRKAVEVYDYVLRTGRSPSGYVGGRIFENREGRLDPGGDYHEYDVNPKMAGVNRGAERLIVDLKSRRGWYTADHYRTFIAIERSPRER